MSIDVVKKHIPSEIKNVIKRNIDRINLNQARKAFDSSGNSPAWLDIRHLHKLQQKYPPFPSYGYDSESLLHRGEERAQFILNLFKEENAPLKFLEIGCWDGMVSCALKNKGKDAFAIDFVSDGFDKRAMDAGVKMSVMNVNELSFENDTFDCVFCYNTFEHFADPSKAFSEIYRVLKMGGCAYFIFNPVYSAAYGLHAYRSISIPYCHYLFEKETLDDYCKLNNLDPINYKQLNYWTAEMFRKLWNSYEGKFEKISYSEIPDYTALNLIKKFPSCFKSKSITFDDLVISGMECFFKKIK